MTFKGEKGMGDFRKNILHDDFEGRGGGKWVLLGILGGGVTPGSPNSDPISEQEMSFLTPVFRPGV